MTESPRFSSGPFTDAELAAYLDEMLPVERAAVIETAVRGDSNLQQRLVQLLHRRDQGGHTVGEIWRRHQLSCPSRSELGSYLLGVLDDGPLAYIEFHLNTVGCRICQSNLEDLQLTQQAGKAVSSQRTRRYFESSAGILRSQREE
jgi:hypothetical protein